MQLIIPTCDSVTLRALIDVQCADGFFAYKKECLKELPGCGFGGPCLPTQFQRRKPEHNYSIITFLFLFVLLLFFVNVVVALSLSLSLSLPTLRPLACDTAPTFKSTHPLLTLPKQSLM